MSYVWCSTAILQVSPRLIIHKVEPTLFLSIMFVSLRYMITPQEDRLDANSAAIIETYIRQSEFSC